MGNSTSSQGAPTSSIAHIDDTVGVSPRIASATIVNGDMLNGLNPHIKSDSKVSPSNEAIIFSKKRKRTHPVTVARCDHALLPATVEETGPLDTTVSESDKLLANLQSFPSPAMLGRPLTLEMESPAGRGTLVVTDWESRTWTHVVDFTQDLGNSGGAAENSNKASNINRESREMDNAGEGGPLGVDGKYRNAAHSSSREEETASDIISPNAGSQLTLRKAQYDPCDSLRNDTADVPLSQQGVTARLALTAPPNFIDWWIVDQASVVGQDSQQDTDAMSQKACSRAIKVTRPRARNGNAGAITSRHLEGETVAEPSSNPPRSGVAICNRYQDLLVPLEGGKRLDMRRREIAHLAARSHARDTSVVQTHEGVQICRSRCSVAHANSLSPLESVNEICGAYVPSSLEHLAYPILQDEVIADIEVCPPERTTSEQAFHRAPRSSPILHFRNSPNSAQQFDELFVRESHGVTQMRKRKRKRKRPLPSTALPDAFSSSDTVYEALGLLDSRKKEKEKESRSPAAARREAECYHHRPTLTRSKFLRQHRLPGAISDPVTSRQSCGVSKLHSPSIKLPQNPVSATNGGHEEFSSAGQFSRAEYSRVEEFLLAYCATHEKNTEQIHELIRDTTRREHVLDDFWAQLQALFPKRDKRSIRRAVRRHYNSYVRGPWTKKEDESLLEAFKQTPLRWVSISRILNRMPEDCRDRWRNYLKDSDVRRTQEWTEREEIELRMAVEGQIATFRGEVIEACKENRVDFKELAWEEFIRFSAVSAAIGKTRNRLQCLNHWRVMAHREPRIGASYDLPLSSCDVKGAKAPPSRNSHDLV